MWWIKLWLLVKTLRTVPLCWYLVMLAWSHFSIAQPIISFKTTDTGRLQKSISDSLGFAISNHNPLKQVVLIEFNFRVAANDSSEISVNDSANSLLKIYTLFNMLFTTDGQENTIILNDKPANENGEKIRVIRLYRYRQSNNQSPFY